MVIKMPNGLGPVPNLDVRSPASLGNFLNYIALVCVHNHELGERLEKTTREAHQRLRDEVAALSIWQSAREKHENIQVGVQKERREQAERGERRLGRWKLRAETAAAIGGASVFFGGLGLAIGKFVLG